MTKSIVTCPICEGNLGSFHGGDHSDILSKHIIFVHTNKAREIIDCGIEIERLQHRFKKLSGISVRFGIHSFVNQNAMRAVGFSEKEIEKYLNDEWE